ncbi:MAG: insulinase family protein [Planctomycetes bacterium]|nr:insulinase family protein [Planctomycetota bacterium]
MKSCRSLFTLHSSLFTLHSFARQTGIPLHPKDIKYAELDYKVPPASQFREVLSNGMVVYIAEDRMLPTFDLIVTLRAGSVLVPDEKVGLASLTGEQMRDGGTKSMKPEELDERVEFLAASLSISIGETRGRAGLSCLAKDIDEGLALLIETLRYPRFDEERLRLAKEQRQQNIKRRNDSTAAISRVEWGFLMNGSDHFSNRYTSSASLGAITRNDMFEFHRRYIHPGNMIVHVAGDFDRKEMLAKLDKAFGNWPAGETGPTSVPSPDFTPKPGVYMVHKEDVNQGRIAIGHKGVMRGSPDEFPLQVMNGILGASGFRSRLVANVCSDEGLAYNKGSRPASRLCRSHPVSSASFHSEPSGPVSGPAIKVTLCPRCARSRQVSTVFSCAPPMISRVMMWQICMR